MFGPFRVTNPLSGGLLWKIPWKLSKCQKRRQRGRLRAVDNVISVLNNALAKQGQIPATLTRWNDQMPTEAEMLAKDKYTMFDRKEKRYRKGIHSMWTTNGGMPDWTSIWLIGHRATKVDEGVTTSQPAWVLAHGRRVDGQPAGLFAEMCKLRNVLNTMQYQTCLSQTAV